MLPMSPVYLLPMSPAVHRNGHQLGQTSPISGLFDSGAFVLGRKQTCEPAVSAHHDVHLGGPQEATKPKQEFWSMPTIRPSARAVQILSTASRACCNLHCTVPKLSCVDDSANSSV